MKKNGIYFKECKIPGIKKVLNTLKMTVFLILVSVVGVFANKNYLQTDELNPKINFRGQQHMVTGVVTDPSDVPLPGVTIILKGTTNGAVTDSDGKYSISNVPEDGILIFSFVGMVAKEIPVQGKAIINVKLQEETIGLDEVVAIGYGTQKKSDLTGAVGTATAGEMKSLTVANPTEALQGRIAGVNVQSNSGGPGANSSVIIRGVGTINGSAEPLYVVDGIFLESLNSINPNDILSLEVLKDASAAAIYGSRAANGVIIVTTSRGTDKGLELNAHANVGISTAISNKIDFLNARQYADVRNAIDDLNNNTRAPANSTDFDPDIDTDWQSLQLRSGTIQDYGFSLSAGGKNNSVFLSGNYYDEQGVLISSDFEKINMRINSEFWTENKKIRIKENLGLAQSTYNNNYYYGYGGFNIPTIPVQDEDGNFVSPNNIDHGIAFGYNRYAMAMTRDDLSRIDQVFGNISGEFELLPGLQYKLNLGLNFSSNYGYLFVPTYKWSDSNITVNENTEADLTESRSTMYDALMDNILSYELNKGKHSLNAVIGHTVQKTTTKSLSLVGSGFPSNEIRTMAGAEEVTSFGGTKVVTALVSLFGRVFYNYDDKYLVTATLRQDKSSRFAEDYRTGYFPSASFGWKISNEDFFPENEILSTLKMRLSYGELGSQNVDDYAFQAVMNLNSNYDFGEERTYGVSRLKFNVQDLVWETSKTTDIGLDASLFDGKVQLTADYFNRKTEDILVSLSIPRSSGSTSAITTNSASIENRGFEIDLGYKKKEGKFTYDANLSLATEKNKVISLGRLDNPISGGNFSSNNLYSTKAIAGEQVGAFFGYETLGLYQSQSEIDNDPNLSNSEGEKALLNPGELIYKDQNDDGIINDDDKVKIGNPYPDLSFGLNFNGYYKNFEFNLFFQGQLGNEIFNAMKFNTHFEVRSNYTTDLLDAWTSDNKDTDMPVIGTTRVDASDWYIEDGSYVRLKQLRVAYNLKLFNGTTNAKIFVSGQNLLTLTKYSGFDPEIGTTADSGRPSASGVALLTRGIDLSPYPKSRVIMAGIQFSIK